MVEITKDMTIGEILGIDYNLAGVLMSGGMHCVGCPASAGETIEEACSVHGIDVEEVLEILNTINDSEPTYETTILDDSAMWDMVDKNIKDVASNAENKH